MLRSRHASVPRGPSSAVGRWCATATCVGAWMISLLGCTSGGSRPYLDGGTSTGLAGAGAGSAASAEVELPFAVDDHYLESGHMGDRDWLELQPDRCVRRRDGAQGRCHHIEYSAGGPQGWAGMFWLYGDGNWGNEPGLKVSPGARRVTLLAAASPPHEVTFFAGLQETDGFGVDTQVFLTEEYQRVVIDLSEVSYDEVVGAFGWTTGEGGVTLELDDIRWE